MYKQYWHESQTMQKILAIDHNKSQFAVDKYQRLDVNQKCWLFFYHLKTYCPHFPVSPRMGHEADVMGYGSAVGLPWYHITALTRVCVSQLAQRQVRLISPVEISVSAWKDFPHWRLGCSIVSMPPPHFPNPSRLEWLWSCQPSPFVAQTLTSRHFKD